MVVIALFGLCCGGVLGCRFKVFVLVPAHILAVLAAAADAALSRSGAAHLVVAVVVWSAGCNAGYLATAILGPLGRRRGHSPVRSIRALPGPKGRAGESSHTPGRRGMP